MAYDFYFLKNMVEGNVAVLRFGVLICGLYRILFFIVKTIFYFPLKKMGGQNTEYY